MPASPQATQFAPQSGAPSQDARVQLAQVQRALLTLPEEQREALLLVAVEEFRYQEAATILGIPLGTLMSRLGRARAALRETVGSAETPANRTDGPTPPHLRLVE